MATHKCPPPQPPGASKSMEDDDYDRLKEELLRTILKNTFTSRSQEEIDKLAEEDKLKRLAFISKYKEGYHWVRYDNRVLFGYCSHKNFNWILFDPLEKDKAIHINKYNLDAVFVIQGPIEEPMKAFV